MDKEQELRAKSLELAILTFGNKGISFMPEKGSGNNELPSKLLSRAKLITVYIREGASG
jgi:hypothetical protein